MKRVSGDNWALFQIFRMYETAGLGVNNARLNFRGFGNSCRDWLLATFDILIVRGDGSRCDWLRTFRLRTARSDWSTVIVDILLISMPGIAAAIGRVRINARIFV